MIVKPGQPGPGTDVILLSYSQVNRCQVRLWITILTVLHKVRNITDIVAIEIHISVTLKASCPAAFPSSFLIPVNSVTNRKISLHFLSFSFNKPRSHQDKFGSGYSRQSGRLLSEGLRRWGHSPSYTTCGASETPPSKSPVQGGAVSPESKVSFRKSHRRPFRGMGLFSSLGGGRFFVWLVGFWFSGDFFETGRVSLCRPG